MRQSTTVVTTPIGELLLVAQAGELVEIHLGSPHGCGHETPKPGAEASSTADPTGGGENAEVLAAARCQIDDYFCGRREAFSLPARPKGTEFELTVWRALGKVGYGETITYGELAARIGRPRAARAVGRALARNPLPVVVPCHRVVGRLGELTGYAGGFDNKRLLLALESRFRPSSHAERDVTGARL